MIKFVVAVDVCWLGDKRGKHMANLYGVNGTDCELVLSKKISMLVKELSYTPKQLNYVLGQFDEIEEGDAVIYLYYDSKFNKTLGNFPCILLK